MSRFFKHLALAAAATGVLSLSLAAQEGPTPTQTLISINSKAEVVPTPANIQLQLNGKATPVVSLDRVAPAGLQIALLIDEGLRRSIGSQLNDIKVFLDTLPAGTEVLVGYMSNGRVVSAQPFTADHAAAAESLRLPFGSPGMSASPYFCLSDFVKSWPSNGPRKARVVIMLTNGVDPYNGSTRISNQDSPYVQTAIDDANRAGVAVYSIYYGDAGIRGGSFSGQSYLRQVADSTGGDTYYEGTGSPVSLGPFFKQFQHALGETYVASFTAIANHKDHDLVRLKVSTDLPKVKIHHADDVRPGNVE